MILCTIVPDLAKTGAGFLNLYAVCIIVEHTSCWFSNLESQKRDTSIPMKYIAWYANNCQFVSKWSDYVGLDIRAVNRLFLFTYLSLNTPVMTVLVLNDSRSPYALSTLQSTFPRILTVNVSVVVFFH